MDRKILLLFLVIMGIKANAQELQLHYDFGKDRDYLTGTFEIFKPDRLGSTFMFTDIDFNRPDGASLVYFEIARKFNIKNKAIDGLNFHIEYNDGFLISKGESPVGIPIKPSALTGIGFPVKIGNFTLHTSYLYKWIKDSNGLDGQFTAVWFQNFAQNKITFRGFLDVWSSPLTPNKDLKYAIFITEPQLLYNLNEHFSVGTEIEISKNFVPSRDFRVNPTVMVRWVL
ncbi:DUF5020 family protein [Ornithobacterium rhinotracheale]|uniref:DUF5020 family protein n=1 Tax=Ornithobacterium rhinotracheale TaxID=28251 RepID=UPI001FF51FA4|nr:DUF5020 family protein [Ornithobacterium rhinotracheale]MCK0203438.1 DUF5020 family protein [Ornithobacterium rhinotracheale]